MPPRNRTGPRAAFAFIFTCTLISSLSFGITLPVLPNLIKQFLGGDTAAAAQWTVVFAITLGSMQVFCGPFLGLVSDRIGRRPVLLISLFGLWLNFALLSFAPTLNWLLVGRVVHGVTASSFAAANAYVADMTEPQLRAQAFGWMGSAVALGYLLGPVVGGLLGEINLRLPFVVAGAFTVMNWLYGYFVLPESLPPERRSKRLDWARANPLDVLSFLSGRRELLGLASVNFLFNFALSPIFTVMILYCGHRYQWSVAEVGAALMVSGVLNVLVQTFCIRPVVATIGERGALLAGAVCGALAFILFGLAPVGWLFLAAAPVFAASGLLPPAVQALMTARVGPQEQGRLQGVNQCLQALASVLGTVIFGMTFAWSIREEATLHAPGLAFYLASIVFGVTFFIGLKVAAPSADGRGKLA